MKGLNSIILDANLFFSSNSCAYILQIARLEICPETGHIQNDDGYFKA
jgi:hypothetical protein